MLVVQLEADPFPVMFISRRRAFEIQALFSLLFSSTDAFISSEDRLFVFNRRAESDGKPARWMAIGRDCSCLKNLRKKTQKKRHRRAIPPN